MTKKYENVKTKFSRNLKKYRKQVGITQTELARQVKTSPVVISQLERGHHLPSLTNFFRITKALEIKSDQLIQPNYFK